MYPVIEWKNNTVIMIDQRKLPLEELYIEHKTYSEVANSIKEMVIRGAPAIGVAAAMGVALGINNETEASFESGYPVIVDTIRKTRPTAVNLFWALERMDRIYQANKTNFEQLKRQMIDEAIRIDREDYDTNRRIGSHGESLIDDGQTVLTHCNAGALATAGYGTALGVIRAAVEKGKRISVIAGETRPFLQGARLTAWELHRDNIDVTLATDNMAGYLMKNGEIDAVVVGADRIAANGDVANKIGTYSLAILADFHRIPFYVAAPLSTIDTRTLCGDDIPIEQRPANEVTAFMNRKIAPDGINTVNPAFDVTPNRLITAIVTETGILSPDYTEAISKAFSMQTQ